MAHLRNPRLEEIPPEHRETFAAMIRECGIEHTVRLSGIGRSALLSIVAQGVASRGTASLVREVIARLASKAA